jgi:hypothetical protein
MNCPGHILIYKSSHGAIATLPVRLGELGTVYRYERSGTMHGLLRARLHPGRRTFSALPIRLKTKSWPVSNLRAMCSRRSASTNTRRS